VVAAAPELVPEPELELEPQPPAPIAAAAAKATKIAVISAGPQSRFVIRWSSLGLVLSKQSSSFNYPSCGFAVVKKAVP
jgi:hypothetical protein